MSSDTPTTPAKPVLLVFCDSLSYYGPTGGLPSDDPRIWPNIVASQLGWDLELIGRLLDAGADPTVTDARFDATPLGWAEHAYQAEAADLLRSATRR